MVKGNLTRRTYWLDEKLDLQEINQSIEDIREWNEIFPCPPIGWVFNVAGKKLNGLDKALLLLFVMMISQQKFLHVHEFTSLFHCERARVESAKKKN